MVDYSLIKALHVATVVISIIGFILRLGMLWLREAWLGLRPVKIVPHVNDTLLLLTGIALAALSRQYPLAQAWLTMKLVALVGYILLGMLALKPRFGKPLRLAFGAMAVLVFAYIVGVARTRSVWPV